MFQHFGNRLKRDLKQIVDRRLDANATASGSQLRVRRTILHAHRCRADPYCPQSSGVEVDVISHKRQRCVVPVAVPILD